MAHQYTTYNNPAVPFRAVISGGFKPGKMITISGFVPQDTDRFDMNVRYDCGIALHYSVRFNQNVVVRNSQMGGSWCIEELDGPMPFKRGQPFTMTIFCESESFITSVNGAEAFKFKHRCVQLKKINSLDIDKVVLTSVTV